MTTATRRDKPMMWLDVLDAPTINFYETSFGEDFGSPTQETTRRDGDSLSFYGSGVLPDGTAPSKRTPIINYTYARTRPIIERMMAAGDIDKSHGARVRYANPSTGGPVLPTMGANLAMLPKGLPRRALPLNRQHRLRLRRGAGHDDRRWAGAGMGPARCLRRAIVEALRPHLPLRSRCCSRSRTARRRKRSASGGRGSRARLPERAKREPQIRNHLGDGERPPKPQPNGRRGRLSGDCLRLVEEVNCSLQRLDVWKADRVRAALRHRPIKRMTEAWRLAAQLL